MKKSVSIGFCFLLISFGCSAGRYIQETPLTKTRMSSIPNLMSRLEGRIIKSTTGLGAFSSIKKQVANKQKKVSDAKVVADPILCFYIDSELYEIEYKGHGIFYLVDKGITLIYLAETDQSDPYYDHICQIVIIDYNKNVFSTTFETPVKEISLSDQQNGLIDRMEHVVEGEELVEELSRLEYTGFVYIDNMVAPFNIPTQEVKKCLNPSQRVGGVLREEIRLVVVELFFRAVADYKSYMQNNGNDVYNLLQDVVIPR